MRLVVNNSDAEVTRRREMEIVAWSLRQLTANLVRVVRGRGSAYKIGSHAVALIEALESYRKASGAYPSDYDLALALVYEPRWANWSKDPAEHALSDAKRTVISGALQMVASEMLGQRSQASTGESEMIRGIRAHEVAIERMNAAFRKGRDEAKFGAVVAKARTSTQPHRVQKGRNRSIEKE